MLDPQVSRFWQAALQSGLMNAEALNASWEAIAPAKRDDPENIDRRLARQAVQSKAVTLWQAQQLLAGRTSGYKVDRYVLLDLIGQGGMGRVYLARDTRLNRRVALKILSPERMSNPRAIARFQREARVGAQLQHENLVRIYDFGESNGRYFLVMEYIEGKTIGTLISEHGRMAPATAARLVRQVALGLEHANLKGLIHRDVNPYNILVTRDGTAKLADLGLAIDLSEGDHVTREGATVGTFDYVAPEQARHSHSADIRSDIYSLGCSLYHMCAGQVPFPSPSLPEKLFAHQALEPKPLCQLIAGFPEGLSAVVERMMRKSPADRYATPMQLVQALDPYTDDPASVGTPEVGSLLAPNTSAKLASLPLPIEPPNAGKLDHPRAEPIPALVKTVAIVDGSERPSLPVTEIGSGANADEANSPAPGASGNHDPSDPDFPVLVDLGPEPSLTEGLTRVKPRSAVPLDESNSTMSTTKSARRLDSLWLWGAGVVTTVVALLLGIVAIFKPSNDPPPDITAGSGPAPVHKEKPKSTTAPPKTVPSLEPPIAVRSEGESTRRFPAEKLLEALQTAIGSHGWVELRNREPLFFSSDRAINLESGQGRLIIRAAPGLRPVIETELNGNQAFLTTGSGVSLELSGLTIKARYPPQGAASLPPPLITAAGSAKLDRCALIATGGAHPKGSRAIFSDGGLLEVSRCWIQGFDQTINVTAMNRSTARIRQTMIVPTFESIPSQTAPPEWYGWAFKLQFGGGSTPAKTKDGPKPHLALDHCTVEAAGLIDFTDCPAASRLNVDVGYCAINAKAVLACRGGATTFSQVGWQGVGNQYNILGSVWIVLSATEGTPAISSDATDLRGWQRLATGDRDPIPNKLEFVTDLTNRTTGGQPSDFKIRVATGSQAPPGADPALVGPWSSP